ncbi:hypothetical protein JCM14076_08310 [Methylosoma difficile]
MQKIINKLAVMSVKGTQQILHQKAISRWVYNHIYYSRWLTGGMIFFNTGLVPIDDEVFASGITDTQNPQAQTYHEAIKAYRRLTDWHDTHQVLEVGCGLGGGMHYLRRMLPSACLVAIDLSMSAIRRSRKLAPCFYAQADAHALPFQDASFDWILVVECLHKLNVEHFFLEAGRILKPEGVICIVDFRATTFQAISQRLQAACTAQGLHIAEMTDLTERVLQFAEQPQQHQHTLLNAIPWPFRWLGRELLVTPGSNRHSSYVQGQRCYYLCAVQKPAARLSNNDQLTA